ncbi:MAG: Fe/S biogenesis protein NfuA [Synergistetes bacterium ADurb.Bin155]|jgi:Fe-S cluster biogenesis protein NfuA|nr:NifU family protein [Synergistales bacterium]MBP8996401.1 NifU family protein [Synergistales bacterium]OQB45538.1 MAG: Fe/S biogenesis protein NfuA [Synergistetes bacterium ADurb.Bin155]HQL03009.1 NifU family protein [Synergistales bacterium]
MEIEERVKSLIEEQVRPALQSHGGDIELVSFDTDGGVVTVRLKGACGNCPFAAETLRSQVEAVIRKEIPEIEKVVRTE